MAFVGDGGRLQFGAGGPFIARAVARFASEMPPVFTRLGELYVETGQALNTIGEPNAALQRFTRQIADEVTASGAERALEPMMASDRKVVHDTINEIEGLATRSEGEEPRRYIVISSQRPATGGSASSDLDEVEAAEGA